MADENTTAMGVAITVTESIAYQSGAVVSKTIVNKKAADVTLFSFDKGQGLKEHTSPFDAMVQVVDGSAKITIAGVDQIVTTGQLIIMPAGKPHALHAVEQFKMILTLIR